MMAWLEMHGGLVVMLVFIAMFLMFAVWAYRPLNRSKLEAYGRIPLEESPYGKK
jgi:cbb3-type cytochrome oxidase subunit 3